MEINKRPRVLHVINSLETGGAEKLLIDSIPFYERYDFEVDILLLNGEKTLFFDKLQERNNGKVYVIANRSIYNPLLAFRLVKYFRQYDIIHGHLFPVLYWLAFAKLINGGKGKIVYTEHSTSNRRRSHPILKFVDRVVYSQYNRVITISREVDERLKKHLGKASEKIFLINNGINLDKIEAAVPAVDTFGFSEGAKVIIQVSSFRYPKDQNTIIRALKILPERFNLLLVGSGELIEESKALAFELQVMDRVIFLGVRMDVPNLLKRADYVVLSSAHEGLSLSSIEGLVSGRPFIASDVPGLTEIVGGAGILFEYKNHVELAKIIEKLDMNVEYRENVIRNSIERAKKYDIRNMVREYVSIYKNIM